MTLVNLFQSLYFQARNQDVDGMSTDDIDVTLLCVMCVSGR